MSVKPLKPNALYRSIPVSTLPFNSTADLADLDVALGQDRAVEALLFGIAMRPGACRIFPIPIPCKIWP